MSDKLTTCYMCDSPATTTEHVPPKCLFPEDKALTADERKLGITYRNQLITVPSCAKHNLEKGKEDEFLRFILLTSHSNNGVGMNHFYTKLKRSIDRRPTVSQSFIRSAFPARLTTGKYVMAIRFDRARLEKALRYVAHGLYYHITKQRLPFPEIGVYTPSLVHLQNSGLLKIGSKDIYWSERIQLLIGHSHIFGDNQEVFAYRYRVDHLFFALALRFYENIEIYICASSPFWVGL